jgi:hypothetical protein
MSAFFLVEDRDGRVGLFSWDPHHTRHLKVPAGAALHDLDGPPERSARQLQRDATTLAAAARALQADTLSPPGGPRPTVLAVVDPPEDLLVERGVRKSWSLPRVVAVLDDGSSEEAWRLAHEAAGWVDVFAAWDNADAPSGLARYTAALPYGSPPEGVDPAATFLRVGTLEDTRFRTDDLPVSLAGTILRLPVSFAELDHIDFAALGPCLELGTPTPAAGRSSAWTLGLVVLVIVVFAAIAASLAG